ncbi:GntR family transcriptional regulator [Mycobacterium sp. SWH-M1]|nr:GntR family transcriptional regulator [Mycobacterium sp. SWH-M1]
MSAPAGPLSSGQLSSRVRREQMSDEVAGRLRTEIMTGVLRPDTFIRLDETAARLGVSITPVREALRTLRGEGMVELERHRGHRVMPLSRTDIEDIFWIQSTIARELVTTAARRIDDTQIEQLVELNAALARAVHRDDPEEIARAEFAFHRAVNRASGRIKLSWFLLHASRYLPPHVFAADPRWGVDAVAGHEVMIDALRRRDVATVVRLTEEQFADGLARLLAYLDRIGRWGTSA